MNCDLSVYVDGAYYGRAMASAKQVAMHTDERECSLAEAWDRHHYGAIQSLMQQMTEKGRDPKAVRVQVRDENKY